MDEGLLDRFHAIEEKHWWWAGRRRLVGMLLAADHPQKMLDIGCGTGETLTYLHQLYPRAQLYGIDTSDAAVRYSKNRGHRHIYKASALKLPFPDKFFDAVLFLDVLEHIARDKQALLESKRVLKPGGKIIITGPALQFIWSRHDTRQGHVRRFTRRQIRALARSVGLDVVFISYFNFIFSPVIISVRLLSKLPFLAKLSDYDNGINFDIADYGLVNSLLTKLFVTEINQLKYLHYPWGISLGASLKKLR